MAGRISWRSGFDINLKVAGWLPVVAVVAAVAGIAASGDETTDMRLSLSPWFMAIAVWCLVGCCLGLLRVHRGESRTVTFGGWWTVLALLGISGFVVAVAIGGVIGIAAEDAGWLAWPPILGAAFGAASIAPAMVVMAWGSLRAYEVGDFFGGFGLHPFGHVGVGVESGGNVGVAEPFLNNLGMHRPPGNESMIRCGSAE